MKWGLWSKMTWRRRDCGEWGFWFRVYGYGLNINNLKPMFSERLGYRKPLFRICGIQVGVLKP